MNDCGIIVNDSYFHSWITALVRVVSTNTKILQSTTQTLPSNSNGHRNAIYHDLKMKNFCNYCKKKLSCNTAKLLSSPRVNGVATFTSSNLKVPIRQSTRQNYPNFCLRKQLTRIKRLRNKDVQWRNKCSSVTKILITNQCQHHESLWCFQTPTANYC
mgnify:CR=1 FL=1